MSLVDPSGLDCVAQGGSVTCHVPSGPTVRFPRPDGWPDIINSQSENYHFYNYPADITGRDKECIENFLRENPTPGKGAASAAGANIDATPNRYPEKLLSNPVKSYFTSYKDANGNPIQVVINVTLKGHGLWPGYVVRTMSGSIVNNYGEGLAWGQNTHHWSNRLTANLISDRINSVWPIANEKMLRECSCKAK